LVFPETPGIEIALDSILQDDANIVAVVDEAGFKPRISERSGPRPIGRGFMRDFAKHYPLDGLRQLMRLWYAHALMMHTIGLSDKREHINPM